MDKEQARIYKWSRKVANIKNNRNVAIVVGVSEGKPSIQINGVAEILTEDKKAKTGEYIP